MKKAIFINALLPLLYFILFVMLEYEHLSTTIRVFVAEYASGLLILQLISCIIGIIICKNLSVRILLCSTLVFFVILLFKTVEGFNPV
jgi:uncharacterized membrane protein YoaK (UPF0700 family)